MNLQVSLFNFFVLTIYQNFSISLTFFSLSFKIIVQTYFLNEKPYKLIKVIHTFLYNSQNCTNKFLEKKKMLQMTALQNIIIKHFTSLCKNRNNTLR